MTTNTSKNPTLLDKAMSDPDAFVFRCTLCDYTAATGSGALDHEHARHGGAQTCWRTIDRDELAAHEGWRPE